MQNRLLSIRAVGASLLLFAFAVHARAECIGTTPSWLFKHSQAPLIFSGTFIKREVISRVGELAPERVARDGERFLQDRTAFGMRLTFEVDRVWKGSAPTILVTYQVLHPDSTDHWKPNTDYLILASRLSDQDRSSLALEPGEDGFIYRGCSGAWNWTPVIEQEVRRAFGRGRKPN